MPGFAGFGPRKESKSSSDEGADRRSDVVDDSSMTHDTNNVPAAKESSHSNNNAYGDDLSDEWDIGMSTNFMDQSGGHLEDFGQFDLDSHKSTGAEPFSDRYDIETRVSDELFAESTDAEESGIQEYRRTPENGLPSETSNEPSTSDDHRAPQRTKHQANDHLSLVNNSEAYDAAPDTNLQVKILPSNRVPYAVNDHPPASGSSFSTNGGRQQPSASNHLEKDIYETGLLFKSTSVGTLPATNDLCPAQASGISKNDEKERRMTLQNRGSRSESETFSGDENFVSAAETLATKTGRTADETTHPNNNVEAFASSKNNVSTATAAWSSTGDKPESSGFHFGNGRRDEGTGQMMGQGLSKTRHLTLQSGEVHDTYQSVRSEPNGQQRHCNFASEEEVWTQVLPIATLPDKMPNHATQGNNESKGNTMHHHGRDPQSPKGRVFQTPRKDNDTLFGHGEQYSSTITPSSSQGTTVPSSMTPRVSFAPKSVLHKSLGTANKNTDEIVRAHHPSTSILPPQNTQKHPHQGASVAVTPSVVVPPTRGSAATRPYEKYVPQNTDQVNVSDRTPRPHHSGVDTDSYEYHQAKFLNEIREAEDMQEKIAAKVLEMNHAFAPHFSTILQQHSGFLDLLNTAEEAEHKADETIRRFKSFFEIDKNSSF